MNKEHNFISAIVFVSEDNEKTIHFFSCLNRCLEEHFLQYELIAVNGNSAHNKLEGLRKWAGSITKPLTVINMSLLQPHEQCMNAGIDISIGDYVYEFDSTEMPYSPDMIWNAYSSAMEGNDIVTVCPESTRWTSRLFYKIFNRYSHIPYQLRTEAFRLVSRRAINRVHEISENLPYRKAAYAASGLKMKTLEFKGSVSIKEANRFELATDSLVLYTDFGYRFSLRLTTTMALIALVELVYTLIIYAVGNPISGWTTTMFVLTLGMTGLFAVFAITLKYQALILRLNFRKQSYLIESIEKI